MCPQDPDPDSLPDSYLSLGQPATAEIRVQRSRFIAIAAPTENVTATRQIIDTQAGRFHDSRHICHAWRLGTPPAIVENRNDDGEPSGTAGEPILVEIRKRELTQVTVVVVRYFGGVKLGTGGLSRAYGQAAREALAAAPERRIRLGRTFVVQFPYARQKTLQHLLTQHEGEIRQEDYGAEVSWSIWLPHSRWQAFAGDLTEATAGTIQLSESPT